MTTSCLEFLDELLFSLDNVLEVLLKYIQSLFTSYLKYESNRPHIDLLEKWYMLYKRTWKTHRKRIWKLFASVFPQNTMLRTFPRYPGIQPLNHVYNL